MQEKVHMRNLSLSIISDRFFSRSSVSFVVAETRGRHERYPSTHQILKILGTTGLGLGFRRYRLVQGTNKKKIWVLMRTGQIKNVGSDAVPGTDQISIHADPWLKHL